MRVYLLLFVAACSSDAITGSDAGTATGPDLWTAKALPALQAADCMTCHATADSLGFLAGATPAAIRDTLLGSQQVDLVLPFNSRLLTKGVHDGPGLTAAQTAAISEWLLSL